MVYDGTITTLHESANLRVTHEAILVDQTVFDASVGALLLSAGRGRRQNGPSDCLPQCLYHEAKHLSNFWTGGSSRPLV
eukprot:1233327-Amphidinium_carterae.1